MIKKLYFYFFSVYFIIKVCVFKKKFFIWIDFFIILGKKIFVKLLKCLCLNYYVSLEIRNWMGFLYILLVIYDL